MEKTFKIPVKAELHVGKMVVPVEFTYTLNAKNRDEANNAIYWLLKESGTSFNYEVPKI